MGTYARSAVLPPGEEPARGGVRVPDRKRTDDTNDALPGGDHAAPDAGAAAARRRRRAQFLRELHEAKELRDRVQPRRARAERMRQALRMRTFRW
ncbi:hypothetical protein San01_33460 [Streptomyces angustmyceticus]|uniref:Uncharacterized protein n=1 Tax=Streptomyces angustmyceticus TaxID=285578 RepID=A0A5J4LGX4_9ACTN|nr:hypothetical protein San01_33460 [Streptomyces angustmyceticus]